MGRMKTRVSNTGGSSTSSNAVPTANQNGTASAPASAASTAASNTNGRRSRLQSVDQVYIANSNNNPLSPRTRASVKQEVDDEVSFVDPLCIVNDNAGCNGENGHAEDDTEDPIAINDDSNNPDTDPNASAELTNIKKKPRKSSAEKFLEDNTEYYGFQDHDNDKHSSIRTTSNSNLDPLEINSTS